MPIPSLLALLALSVHPQEALPPLPPIAPVESFPEPASVDPIASWPAEPDRPGFYVQAHQLGASGQFDVSVDEGTYRYAICPRGERVVRTVRKGSRFGVEERGELGPLFDEILTDPGLTFSEDGEHLAYIGRRGQEHVVVLDGVEGPPVVRVTSELRFAPGSGKLAYTAATTLEAGRETGYAVLFDQEPQGEFGGIREFAVSPSGERVAFWVQDWVEEAGNRNLVVCGELVVDAAEAFAFGPDDRLFVVTTRDDRQHLVVEGEPGPAFDWVELPVFPQHGSAFAYRVATATEQHEAFRGRNEFRTRRGGFVWEVVFGDQRWVQGQHPFEPNPPVITLSADGTRCAFRSFVDPGNYVITDGVASPEYDMVHHVEFDPDGVCTAVVSKGGYVFHLRDGEEDSGRAGQFLNLHPGPPGRYAAQVLLASAAAQILTEQGAHECSGMFNVGALCWSSDGGRLSYQLLPYAGAMELPQFVVDGEPRYSTASPNTGASHVRADFTPNGEHLWWFRTVREENPNPQPGQRRAEARNYLFVDGERLCALPTGSQIQQLTVTDDGAHALCWESVEPSGPRVQLVVDGRIVTPPWRPVVASASRTPDAWYAGASSGPHPAAGHVTADGHWQFLAVHEGDVVRVRYALADLWPSG